MTEGLESGGPRSGTETGSPYGNRPPLLPPRQHLCSHITLPGRALHMPLLQRGPQAPTPRPTPPSRDHAGAPSGQAPTPHPLSAATLEQGLHGGRWQSPLPPPRQHPSLQGCCIEHLLDGWSRQGGAPCSQPPQGEALVEAEAKVAHGENLWEKGKRGGYSLGGGNAEHPFPCAAWLSSAPPEARHGLLCHLLSHQPCAKGWDRRDGDLQHGDPQDKVPQDGAIPGCPGRRRASPGHSGGPCWVGPAPQRCSVCQW